MVETFLRLADVSLLISLDWGGLSSRLLDVAR